jgi:hypothetical protein
MTSGGGGVGGFLLSQESFLLCKLSRDLLAVKHFCRERERERELHDDVLISIAAVCTFLF